MQITRHQKPPMLSLKLESGHGGLFNKYSSITVNQ